MHIAKRRKPVRRGCVLSDSARDVLEKAKLCRQSKDKRLPGMGTGEGRRGGARRSDTVLGRETFRMMPSWRIAVDFG